MQEICDSVHDCYRADISRPLGLVSLQEKVAALRSPSAYGLSSHSIVAIETHFAWVFLADQLAYKLKKPFRNEYVDLSALQARRANCVEELRLNRRLAPDVYLDVVPLTRSQDGSLRIDGNGMVVDWLLKMRRLPAEAMLDAAITGRKVNAASLADVACVLARFYKRQERIAFESHSYVSRLRAKLLFDRAELLAPDLQLQSESIEALAQAQMNACDVVEPHLRLRARQGRVVEAHGDLRPEHICLSKPPCVIDSLEFSRDLRILDPAEELAFLAVECARLGQGWVGYAVLDAYQVHARDVIHRPMFDFYCSRRAAVRAKLMAWHLRDTDLPGLADWRGQAMEYLDIARRHAMEAVRKR